MTGSKGGFIGKSADLEGSLNGCPISEELVGKFMLLSLYECPALQESFD